MTAAVGIPAVMTGPFVTAALGDPAVAAAIRPGPLVVAALLTGVLVLGWRRLSGENRAIAAVAAIGLAVYGSGLVRPPDPEELIRGVGETLGVYTYALVGAMAFLETGAFVGLVAPGEFTVIFGGVVAGQGHINVVFLIGLVWTCAVAGDTTSYLLGRSLGRGFLVRHGRRVKITRARLEQVEEFFDQHGGKTILFGRFIGLVRAMAPFIAGASHMPLRRFLPYDVVSAGLWSATFCLLGYFFWHSFDQVVELARRGALALGVVIAAVVGGVALYRYLRVPANRARVQRWLDEQEDRPALRPLARVLRPLYRRVGRPLGRAARGPARFVWERLTPGELGLELTTLLAVALVGGYVFAVLVIDVGADRAFLADGRAFELAGGLHAAAVVNALAAVGQLGELPVAASVAAAAVVYLLARREVMEAATIAVGSMLTYAGVELVSAAHLRSRPQAPLVDAAGSGFPSEHAAYAVVYVAAVVALVRVLPSFAYRAAFVIAAVVLAAVIGLSRVYLHVNYLSDVLAGWALGAAAFAACGLVAMLVAFVRHNARGS